MNFDFTEEQELFRDSIRSRVEADLIPNFLKLSKKEGVEATLFVCKKLSEWGMLGYGVSEELGGQGIDINAVEMGIFAEEIGRGSNAWATIFLELYLWTKMVANQAPVAIREKYLKPLLNGDLFIPLLLTEPHGGSDMSDVRVTAFPEGEELVINGAKAAVTGGWGEVMFVLARLVPDTKGNAGLGLILVPGQDKGVSFSGYKDWGMKEIARGDVFFDNVHVPKENVIAPPGKGFQQIMMEFDKFRPSLALMSAGSAERAMEDCIKYAKNRMSFGKPLVKYEGISFSFAEHATRMEATKLLAYKALWSIDEGKHGTKYASMSKWFGCEAAIDALWFCARTYGHLGYTEDMDIMQRMLDVMGWAWGDGGWEIQKMVIAREVFGRELIPYDRPK